VSKLASRRSTHFRPAAATANAAGSQRREFGPAFAPAKRGGTSARLPRSLPMQTERAKLVNIVEMPADGEAKTVALLFDNMRWVLFYSNDPADYDSFDMEIGSTVTMMIDDVTATVTGLKH
jgi:hypothetical protein